MIGGEFIIDESMLGERVSPASKHAFKEGYFYHSGRSALLSILRSLRPKNKVALLPAYTCESVIAPFISEGYTLRFYPIKKDLSVFPSDIISLMEKAPGILLTQAYFGFDTLKSVRPLLKGLIEKGWLIVDDITHSWMSPWQAKDSFAHASFCSLRKWFALFDGAWASLIPAEPIESNALIPERITALRKHAMNMKAQYIAANKKLSERENEYLALFAEAEQMLDEKLNVYEMSDASKHLLFHYDIDHVCQTRRQNYLELHRQLCIPPLSRVLGEATSDVCPMFFPVFASDHRDALRAFLRENEVYCPIHWPVSHHVQNALDESTFFVYRSILSIPCDQRYTKGDMDIISNLILEFYEQVRRKND